MATYELRRFSSQEDSTLGLLMKYTGDNFVSMYSREFKCFTLEDEYRRVKVDGETRIPAGTYELRLRKEGGFHDRYSERFPDFHVGMIEIVGVPGFTFVLMHCGNKDEDTAGCVLVGDSLQQNITEDGYLGASATAYKRIYPEIVESILKEPTFLRVVNVA